MTEDERKTMIEIAKSVDRLAERIKNLESGTSGVSRLGEITPDVLRNLLRTPPGMHVTSTIEHSDRAKRFKMEVQFEGAHLWEQRDRMMKCEVFLEELEEIFREYGVIKLSGSYVGPSKSFQA